MFTPLTRTVRKNNGQPARSLALRSDPWFLGPVAPGSRRWPTEGTAILDQPNIVYCIPAASGKNALLILYSRRQRVGPLREKMGIKWGPLVFLDRWAKILIAAPRECAGIKIMANGGNPDFGPNESCLRSTAPAGTVFWSGPTKKYVTPAICAMGCPRPARQRATIKSNNTNL